MNDRVIPVQKHPKGNRRALRFDPVKMELTDAVRLDLTTNEFREIPEVRERFSKFIDRLLDRNGRKLSTGTQLYNKLLSVIIKIYIQTLIDVIGNAILGGDKIVLHSKYFMFYIADLPPWKRWRKRKYKYYRHLDGQFPILKIALRPRHVYPNAYVRQVIMPAMLIDGYYGYDFGRMIQHKIMHGRVKYSNDWIHLIKIDK